MKKFCQLFDQIDQTQSTNEKVQYLAKYFADAPSEDAVWALFFLSGNRFKRLLSGRTLLSWCIEKINIPDWLASESYAAVGDSAETIALLYPDHFINGEDLPLSQWIENRILPLRKKEEEEQKKIIFSWWDELNKQERFVLNKILTGNFRVGVSHLLTIRGLSEALKLPTESLSLKLSGNWEPTKDFFDSLKNAEALTDHLNPFPFYLASPLETDLIELGEPSSWLAEWKWDGIRAQCIVRNGKAAIWSRGNELITHQFPEIEKAILSLEKDFVLDGELLAFQNDKPLPFAELQKRLGRKKPSAAIINEVPIVFMIYDLLEYDHEDLRKRPLNHRRELLNQFVGSTPYIRLSEGVKFEKWEEITAYRLKSKEYRTEGIMLKRTDSLYGVGRQRGHWWKYKVDPMTIDVVLLYAEPGSGRRANLYTDYTFGAYLGEELVPVAKAYSGLTQEEINEMDRWIRRNTEEKFGPVRRVKAERIFEIAFEGIQESKRHKSGIALRFPRILRWRQDKPLSEIDTVENIKKTFLNG